MSANLVIHAAGPGTTLQDGGRHGYLRFGVSAAGPMDWLAHARANILAGNAQSAAAIEVALGGIEIGAEGGGRVAGLCRRALRDRAERTKLCRPPVAFAWARTIGCR